MVLPKPGIAPDGIKYAVKFDREWREWQVRAYRKNKNGAWKFCEGPTYYSHDKEDAIQTFHHLVGYAPGYTRANPRRRTILVRVGKKLYRAELRRR